MRLRASAVAAIAFLSGCEQGLLFSSDDIGGLVVNRWYQSQPGLVYACPLILEELVDFPTADDEYVARDRGTGAVRWKAEVPGAAIGTSALAVGDMVVAPGGFHTTGFYARTGHWRWRYGAPLDTL